MLVFLLFVSCYRYDLGHYSTLKHDVKESACLK